MKKTLLALSLIGFIGLNTLTVMAEPPEKFGPPHKFNKQEFLKKKAEFDKKLNLTDAQKTQAEQLRQAMRTEMKPLMEQMKSERQKFVDLVQAKAPQEEISAQKEKIKALHKTIQEYRKEHMGKFEAILTPKQKSTLDKMKAERKNEFKKFKDSKKFGKHQMKIDDSVK